MKTRSMAKRGAIHTETGYTDDTWTWIEGLKNGVWMPLYCYREQDNSKAQAVVSHILRERREGHRLPDNLGEFSDFRLHLCGQFMESEIVASEIRSQMSMENLARILSHFNKTECGMINPKNNKICVRKPGHEGKHSPTRRD